MGRLSNFIVIYTFYDCVQHVPTETDPTHHLLDVHKLCRKKKHLQWQRMTNYGIVDSGVLRMLLTEYSDNYNRLVRLMVKFGLLVHLQSSDSHAGTTESDNDEYLVPALLPEMKQNDSSWSDQNFSTCYLVFTANKEFEGFTTITENDLQVYGFLPKGLFERLLGKAVTWVRNSPAVCSIISLTHSIACIIGSTHQRKPER